MLLAVEILGRVRGRGLGRLIGVLIAGLSDGEPWAIGVTVLLVVVIGLVIWSKLTADE